MIDVKESLDIDPLVFSLIFWCRKMSVAVYHKLDYRSVHFHL
jgi:hypothetical protein